jgi:hypothetical protein
MGLEVHVVLCDFFLNLQLELLPDIISKPGVIGAVLVENNLSVANEGRRAQGIESPENETPEWVIIIEAQDSQVLSAKIKKEITVEFSEFGISSTDIKIDTYNLMFGNNR